MRETKTLVVDFARTLVWASGIVVHGSAQVRHSSIEELIGATTLAWDLISLLTRTAQAFVRNVL